MRLWQITTGTSDEDRLSPLFHVVLLNADDALLPGALAAWRDALVQAPGAGIARGRATFAELEKETIVGRLQGGRAHAKANGRVYSREASYGLRPGEGDAKGQLVEDPAELAAVARIKALRAFAESDIYRRHAGLGEGGLTMEQVDEKVHEVIKVVGS